MQWKYYFNWFFESFFKISSCIWAHTPSSNLDWPIVTKDASSLISPSTTDLDTEQVSTITSPIQLKRPSPWSPQLLRDKRLLKFFCLWSFMKPLLWPSPIFNQMLQTSVSSIVRSQRNSPVNISFPQTSKSPQRKPSPGWLLLLQAVRQKNI